MKEEVHLQCGDRHSHCKAAVVPGSRAPQDKIYGAKIDAGRGTVSWDWEGVRRRAEVVLAKQEHLPAYSMRIGQKRRVSTAFSLGSGHLNVVSGLYYINRPGETYKCLVN